MKNKRGVCILKYKFSKVIATVLSTVVFTGFFFSSVATAVLADAKNENNYDSSNDGVTTFKHFCDTLQEQAKKYEGKTFKKVFGNQFAPQWCAKYCDKMLNDAYDECMWKKEDAWGAYQNNLILAPAWAKGFIDNEYGGYFCWKSWESSYIGYAGKTTDNTDCYIPREGDVICINWHVDPNKPPELDEEGNEIEDENKGHEKDINHVGIIVRVDSMYSIYVSEGNTGGEKDPVDNKVLNRYWTRDSLDGMFKIESGDVVAVCRPKFPVYARNMEIFDCNPEMLTFADEMAKEYYATSTFGNKSVTTSD